MELNGKILPQWIDVETDGEKLQFLCAPLTSAQFLNLIPHFNLTVNNWTGDGTLLACKYAVRDWRGITHDGQPVPYTERDLERFFEPMERHTILRGLATQITLRSSLTEIERKN